MRGVASLVGWDWALHCWIVQRLPVRLAPQGRTPAAPPGALAYACATVPKARLKADGLSAAPLRANLESQRACLGAAPGTGRLRGKALAPSVEPVGIAPATHRYASLGLVSIFGFRDAGILLRDARLQRSQVTRISYFAPCLLYNERRGHFVMSLTMCYSSLSDGDERLWTEDGCIG